MRPITLVALATMPLAVGAADARAQTGIEIVPRAASVTVGGRLQTQFQASTVAGAAADLFIRRARVRLDVRVSDLLDARLNPELSGGGATLQDAWVRMTFDDAFRLSVGQFKRAFSLFELSSSTDLPVIERDGRIEGVGGCSGVGGLCSFSRLTGALEFDGRDQGVRVDGRLGRGFSYSATVTNGEGVNAGDVNDRKSFSGRLVHDAGGVRLGAFAGLHDRAVAGDVGEDTDYSPSGGLDLEVGTWRDGFHLLAALALGRNWRADGEPRFTTCQALGSYHHGLGGERIAGVEPLLRVSWADPDAEVADDAGLLVTPGLMVHFGGKNGVSTNLDVYVPRGDADVEMSLKVQTYLYF